MYKLESFIKQILIDIKSFEDNKDYDSRNQYIYYCLALSQMLGYKSGIKIDQDEPDWPVIFIELPTGQISWHVPQYESVWDKHTTDEKYKRIELFVRQ